MGIRDFFNRFRKETKEKEEVVEQKEPTIEEQFKTICFRHYESFDQQIAELTTFVKQNNLIEQIMCNEEMNANFVAMLKANVNNSSFYKVWKVLGASTSKFIVNELISKKEDSIFYNYFAMLDDFSTYDDVFNSADFINFIDNVNKIKTFKAIILGCLQCNNENYKPLMSKVVSVLSNEIDADNLRSFYSIINKSLTFEGMDLQPLKNKIISVIEANESLIKNYGELYLKCKGVSISTIDKHDCQMAKMQIEDGFKQEKEAGKTHSKVPTPEEMMMVRVVDVFPSKGTIRTLTNSNLINTTVSTVIDETSTVRLFFEHNKEMCESVGYQYKVGDLVCDLSKYSLCENYDKFIKKYNLEIPYLRQRDTIHFTLNCAVTKNNGGDWRKYPFVIIDPYIHHKDQIENLIGYDTWVFGDVHLKQPTLIIKRKNLEKMMKDATKDPRILEDLLAMHEIVVIDGNIGDLTMADFTNAVLHQKGYPAYRCGDMSVIAEFNDKMQTIDPGINVAILKEVEAEKERRKANGDLLEIDSLPHSCHFRCSEEDNKILLSRCKSVITLSKMLGMKQTAEMKQMETIDFPVFFDKDEYYKSKIYSQASKLTNQILKEINSILETKSLDEICDIMSKLKQQISVDYPTPWVYKFVEDTQELSETKEQEHSTGPKPEQ